MLEFFHRAAGFAVERDCGILVGKHFGEVVKPVDRVQHFHPDRGTDVLEVGDGGAHGDPLSRCLPLALCHFEYHIAGCGSDACVLTCDLQDARIA